jgi:hypothetical protein
VLFDLGDVAGIAGSWSGLAEDKRGPGLALAAGAAVAGGVLLAVARD